MQPHPPLVLVVEDDPAIAAALTDVVETGGYRVAHAADGPTALARIEQGDVDLVLLDRALPGIDGLEVCRRVRAREGTPYLPIIMLTALADSWARHAGFVAGVDDYVAKPFEVQDLLDRVQVWVQTGRRLRAAHEQLQRQQAALREQETQARLAAERERALAEQRALNERLTVALAREAALLQEAEARAHAFQVLHEAAVAASGAVAPAPLAQLVVDRARDLLGVESTALYWWDETASMLRLLAEQGLQGFPSEQRGSGLDAASLAFQRRQPVVVERYPTWEHACPAAVAAGVQSVLAVPLLVQDAPRGVLQASALTPRLFTAEQVHLLTLLAAQIAPAIEAAHAHAEADRRRAEAEALADLARAAAAESDPEQILALLAELSRRLLGADYAAVALLEPDHTFSFHGMAGVRSDEWWTRRLPASTSAAGLALAARHTVVLERLGDDPALPTEQASIHAAEQGRTVLCTPLTGQRGPLGSLLLGWRTDVSLRAEAIRLVEALADQAGTALDNARAVAELAANAEELWLLASERSAVIEQLPCGVIIVGRDGQLVHLNDAGHRILNGTGDGLAAVPTQPVARPGHASPTDQAISGPQALIARALSGEVVERQECLLQPPGAPSEQWLQTSAVPLRDAAGEVIGAVAIFDDVTRERELMQGLAASEERFRTLFEAMGCGIVVVSPAGAIVEANLAMQRITGRTLDQLQGTAFDALGTVEHAAPAHEGPVARALRTGQPIRGVTLRLTRPDGQPCWLLVDAIPVPAPDGALAQVVCSCIDVTAREQAEAALRASEEGFRLLVEAVKDYAIIRLDPDGRVASWNAGAERLQGYTEAEILGQPIAQFFPADGSWDVHPSQALAAAATQGRWAGVGWCLRKDGSRFWANVVISALRDQRGHLVGFAQVTHDATEQREAERRREALAHAEKLRALGQMASGVAHDLNQYLGLVAAHGDLAHRALAATPIALDDLRESLDIITKAAMDGAESVRRLLAFARPGQHTAPEPVDVGAVLREVAKLTAPQWFDAAQAQGRPISLYVQAARHLVIEGWPENLREAFTNLVFNAVDALPEGGTICLRAYRQARTVVVEVADTGIGMTPEVQTRLFEPFFSTKGERGTGLGLAVVFSVVQRHRGQIIVESAPGQGSLFRLIFPAATRRRRRPAPPAPAAPCVRPRRILAVDDVPAMGRTVARVLSLEGHTVTVATSAEEALQRLRQEPFDLVISDVGRGAGMNGWELAEHVCRHYPGVWFALATGWGAQIDPEEARARGVRAVLAKPYRAAELQRLVADLAAASAPER